MRTIRSICAAAALAMLVPASAAATSHSCTSIQVIDVGVGYYVDVRDEPGNLWIYEESNGIAGLQPGGLGDEGCELYDQDGVPIPADTVIF